MSGGCIEFLRKVRSCGSSSVLLSVGVFGWICRKPGAGSKYLQEGQGPGLLLGSNCKLGEDYSMASAKGIDKFFSL